MNAARVSSPRAIRDSRASQAPVSSGEARLFSGRASMRPMPIAVGTRFLPSRATKVRRISVSIVAARVAGDPHVEAVVGRADRALYRAKAAGRNRVESAEP